MLLERLLANLSIDVEPFAVCEVEGGCRLALEEREHATVHFVLAGCGRLRTSARSLHFGPGTLLVVPRGRHHEIVAHDGTAAPRPAAIGLEHHRSLGTRHRPDVVTACGRLIARFGDAHRLFELLEEPIALDYSNDEAMAALFAEMLEESGTDEPGSVAMLSALMNRCLVSMFRRLCGTPECKLPWLNALEDDRMSGALDLMISDPGHNHSVESLAAAVAMSRTAFATEFRVSFGTPPMSFLRALRLRRAAEMLTTSSLGIGAIAARVGFRSRAHFSTAFRREFGLPPGSFRSHESSAA